MAERDFDPVEEREFEQVHGHDDREDFRHHSELDEYHLPRLTGRRSRDAGAAALGVRDGERKCLERSASPMTCLPPPGVHSPAQGGA